jgi:hypothetical protein
MRSHRNLLLLFAAALSAAVVAPGCSKSEAPPQVVRTVPPNPTPGGPILGDSDDSSPEEHHAPSFGLSGASVGGSVNKVVGASASFRMSGGFFSAQ